MHFRIHPAAVLCLALSAFAGIAQAVEFDASLKAPQVKGAPEIKTMAESYSAKFGRVNAASPAELVTDRSLFLERFEFEWQLQRALDEKRPLEELSAVGLVKQADGSISIDMGAYPQWDPFPKKLASFLPTMNLDNVSPLLINRGFRESDVAALKNYVSTHDLKAVSMSKGLPIAVSFSKVVKKLDKMKRPVTNDLVLSFLYQRSKAEALAQREWAEGVLNVLDAQRVRVLHSYFSEIKGTATWYADDVDAGVAGLLALMRLPDFEQRATAEARGAAQ